MPSERFYKLPIQKQMRIQAAVIKEFQAVPIEQVSFQKIAAMAGVSRGSLYTYFENKQDALVYIVEETQEVLWENFKKNLLKEGGDFWKAIRDSVHFNMNYCKENQMFWIMRYASMKPQYNPPTYENICKILNGRRLEELFEWIYQHTEKQHFKITSKDEFFTFLDICFSLMTLSLQEYAKGITKKEQVEASLERKLHQIMLGVCV